MTSDARRVRTVFLGTGSFAVPSLEALTDDAVIELAGVVTAPPRPAGRRRELALSPVGAFADARGLPLLTPARLRSPESIDRIRVLAPDLLVLADYGQIVPAELLELPPHGALNVHPSLLPRHRGATPIPAAILEGDAETGVTVIRMDTGLDTGPIVAQRTMPLSGRETAPELERRLAREGADLLRQSLRGWLSGSIRARPQSETGATLTRPLRREDGRLDPMRAAQDLERQVRAYQPWPGSFLETDGGRIVVWRATVAADAPTDDSGGGPVRHPAPGVLLHGGRDLYLVTGVGALRLDEVQPSGGRRMSGAELVRGRPDLVGGRTVRVAYDSRAHDDQHAT